MSMESMMAKLLKVVESSNAGAKEMRSALLTMIQLVDSHSTSIKHLEQQMNQLSAIFNQIKSKALPSNTV